MHLPPLIQDLAVILAVAGLMSLLFQRIRQPVVLGYVVAGMIVGPYTPPFQFVTDVAGIRIWAELGVIFLMFSLGLEFSFRKLARVGASAGITATVEVLFFLPVGYAAGRLFGWSPMDSVFLGAMLSISSTTIIIKALEELQLKTRRFAELIFAVLIVEDLFAILLLVGLTTVASSGAVSGVALLAAAARLVLVVGGWFLVGYFLVPRFMRYVGRVGGNEMLTLLSLGLCLGLVVLATRFHYSAALGAFIMGSILAESPLLHRIESRMEPLRDLFGAVFFVSIGMLLDPRMLWQHKGAIAALCALTIAGKILSTGLGALTSGQTLKDSVRVGFGLAQIGEFSFIIATLGMTLEVTSDFIYPVAVAVSIVTTFTTPYLIRASGPIAEKAEASLPRGLRELLNRYALWHEARRTATETRRESRGQLLRWFLNGLCISILFALVASLLVAKDRLAPGVGWLLSVLLASPFLWAMTSESRLRGLPLHLFRAFALVWVAALSFEYFPARWVALITSLALILGIGIFYRRLEASYRWLEKEFLSAFEPQGPARGEVPSPRLAPWDAHLVRVRVHPNAELAGRTLAEAELRKRHGLNVVAIQRGQESLVTPGPGERLFPEDELLILGKDENIETAQPLLATAAPMEGREPALTGYELKHASLDELGPLPAGSTIRESGIRERLGAMVVGVERGGERIMNPDSDMPLREGDVLWVVGPTEKLARLPRHPLTSRDGPEAPRGPRTEGPR